MISVTISLAEHHYLQMTPLSRPIDDSVISNVEKQNKFFFKTILFLMYKNVNIWDLFEIQMPLGKVIYCR